MKQRVSLILAAIFFLFMGTLSFATEIPFPLESEAIVVMETTTGKVIYEKNANNKMYPASTTKILTALIALENASPNEMVEIGKEVYSVPLDASKAGHNPGDQLKLEELLYALLLPSGNDSAYSVARFITQKITGNENIDIQTTNKEFSALMNSKAKELGASQSNFVNPHGYHDDNHYTTAYDMALITREAIKNPALSEIISKYEYNMVDSKTGKTTVWKNRNGLLNSGNQNTYYPYAIGGKTGFTDQAGECLISIAKKDDLSFISVILKSPSEVRWNESKVLFDYGFENYTLNKFISAEEIVDTIVVDKHSPKGPSALEVIATEDFVDLIKNEDIPNVVKTIEWNVELVKAPVQAGQEVGKVIYKFNNTVLKEVKLAAKYDVEKETILEFALSIQAIPYWCGIIGGGAIIIGITKMIIKRKKNRGFRLR